MIFSSHLSITEANLELKLLLKEKGIPLRGSELQIMNHLCVSKTICSTLMENYIQPAFSWVRPADKEMRE
jgi:hypothetical protein